MIITPTPLSGSTIGVNKFDNRFFSNFLYPFFVFVSYYDILFLINIQKGEYIMSNPKKTILTDKDTEVLFEEIKETRNIYTFIENNSEQLYRPSLADYLIFLLNKYNLTKSKLIYLSGISRQYAYEIFSGQKHPSREKVLSIILSLHSTLEESQRLLTYAGHHPLHPKDLRDSIIIHSIQQKMSLVDTNDIFYTLSLPLID
jgi:hypothetical protein